MILLINFIMGNMKSLTLAAYSSIILNEPYFELMKEINDLNQETKVREDLAKERLSEYLAQNETQTDFSVYHIRERCIGVCFGNCKDKHYPTLVFTLYSNILDDIEFYIQMIVYKDNSITLIIDENYNGTRTVKATRKSNETWEINICSDVNEAFLEEVTKFLADINPLIVIYIDSLNRKKE